MDPQFLQRYNEELLFIREMGVEFSKRYPKIAGRLDLGSMDCADPYVERLLEGFAFLTARIQLKMDEEFPRFTQHLLEKVYPHYLSPTPSMAVVEFEPDLKGGVTEIGFDLPRNTELRSAYSRKGHVNCEFRTAHAVKLWPIQITNIEYLSLGEAGHHVGDRVKGMKSAIRIQLETTGGLAWNQLDLHTLPFYIRGAGGDNASELYELLVGHTLAILVSPGNDKEHTWQLIHRRHLTAQGFDQDQALLPYGPESFSGYRYLHEYFTLPQRFQFIEITALNESVQRASGDKLDIVLVLDEARPELQHLVDQNSLVLNCSPAINLFHKRADRIHLDNKYSEHHLVIDRTRPRDYEVYSVQSVTGFGGGSIPEQEFRAFYSSTDQLSAFESAAYYTSIRKPALEPVKMSREVGMRSSYLGSEVYLSLVDANDAPYRRDLRQLGANVLCTNRHLPQYISPGQGKTDFTLEIGAPVNSVKCIAGPTDPQQSYPKGEYNWRLINHLSLNYLTLLNDGTGANALSELLGLYGDFSSATMKQQINGVVDVSSEQVVRRIPGTGPMSFGRGVEISIALDEAAFTGSGEFLFSAVLERFFSKYVSLNSFTQTVVKTRNRGQIMRWPVRTGTREVL